MRRWMVVATMIVSLLLPASSAAGGGWWSSIALDGTYMAVGAEVTIDAEVWTDPGEIRYFAYLMPFPSDELWDRVFTEYNPDWWVPQENSLLLGELSFEGGDINTTPSASLTFEVPAVEPGKYAVMFCTEGCTKPLGTTIPTGVMVVSDPGHAAAANKVDDLRMKIDEVRRHHQQDVKGLTRRLEARDRVSTVMDERMDGVDARLLALTAALRQQPDEKPSSLPYLLMGGLVGVALGAAGTRLLKRSRNREPLTDEALREFMARETVP